MARGAALWALLLLPLLGAAVSAAAAPNFNASVVVGRAEITGILLPDSLLWVGDGHVIVGATDTGRAWRSVNSGLTWTDITPTDTADVVDRIVPHPFDPNRFALLMDGSSGGASETTGGIYLSSDAGATLTPAMLNGVAPKRISAFQFHPTEPEWFGALVSVHKSSRDHYQQLMVSRNFGASTLPMASYVNSFSWAPIGISTLPSSALFATVHRRQTGHQDLSPRADVDLVRSDDFFETSRVMVSGSYYMVAADKFIFAAKVASAEFFDYTFQLAVSIDGNVFRNATLADPIEERGYIVLDMSEGAIFLHVLSGDAGSQSGNVYLSGGDGSRYAVSLNDVVVKADSLGPRADFSKVSGLEGIYIANVHAQNTGTTANDERTMITFDKGGEWRPITAPAVDANGRKTNCLVKKGCSLHLLGPTSFHPYPVYSSENAPGLVLATGVVGIVLNSFEPRGLYMSRSGGVDWVALQQGTWMYEFGDQGALLVIGHVDTGITSIKYSWNEGSTWADLQLDTVPFNLIDIVTEPSSVSQEFLVVGSRVNAVSGAESTVVYALNFSMLFERPCNNYNAPDADDSDYETWSPSSDSHADSQCLLGHRTTYVRRKRDAECYNGHLFDKRHNQVDCACTEEDWECNFGYMPDPADPANCIKEPTFDVAMQRQPPYPCIGSYSVWLGAYRPIPGDTCNSRTTDPRYSFETISCPSGPVTPGGLSTGAVVGIVIFVLVLIAALIGLLYWQRYRVLDCMIAVRDKFKQRPSARQRVARQRDMYRYAGIGSDVDTRLFDDGDDDDDDGDDGIAAPAAAASSASSTRRAPLDARAFRLDENEVDSDAPILTRRDIQIAADASSDTPTQRGSLGTGSLSLPPPPPKRPTTTTDAADNV